MLGDNVILCFPLTATSGVLLWRLLQGEISPRICFSLSLSSEHRVLKHQAELQIWQQSFGGGFLPQSISYLTLKYHRGRSISSSTSASALGTCRRKISSWFCLSRANSLKPFGKSLCHQGSHEIIGVPGWYYLISRVLIMVWWRTLQFIPSNFGLKWELAKLCSLWGEKKGAADVTSLIPVLVEEGFSSAVDCFSLEIIFYFSLTVLMLKKWQNQGIVETRKELLRLSPVPLLKAGSATADFLRTMPRQVSSISKDGDHTQLLLWKNCSQYLITITIEKIKFVGLSGIFCISACAHFL